MGEVPDIGRIVQYTLSEADAAEINVRRIDDRASRREQPGPHGYGDHAASGAEAGQVYPAIVVRTFASSFNSVNLQVLLDGHDTYWAVSRAEGDQPGTWTWPPPI
ncbi:hypothetical protein GCM10009530_54030 [Microbispora corallina]|uniref:Uncharacterized protein n=1 Tax=Microbispora corallina TaxID=83302 RepID=A0ABQ4G4P2_9ACTN|nr:hypothetical protein [Microbispora corallina]GIH42045.1 hypothetical protein Mco01_50450 [Microbispora corallina]